MLRYSYKMFNLMEFHYDIQTTRNLHHEKERCDV